MPSAIRHQTVMESRGRPRERERRPPGAGGHKERSRERNPARPAKHRSRTPTRTRLTPVRSSGSGLVRGRDRPLLQGARMDQEPSSRRPHERDRSRERESQGNSKLRMDRGREHMTASRDDLDRKKRGELDRVMKRAREERSSYWNKRVLEAEEKDPSRWGHSGFKELYRRDMNIDRSPSGNHRDSRRSAEISRRKPSSPKPGRRTTRSRSPLNKVNKSRSSHGSGLITAGHRDSGRSRGTVTSRRISPLMSREIPEPKAFKERRAVRNSQKSHSGEKRDRPTVNKSRHGEPKSSANDLHRSRSDNYGTSRARTKSSISVSRSRSRSSGSPPAKVKRSGITSGTSKRGSKSNDDWSRIKSKKTSISLSRSRSVSSSSSSSEDGDVLELHADSRKRGRGSTLSRSSSSSSEESKTSSSSVSSSRRVGGSGSSTSSTSSDSDSDDDSDVSGKIAVEDPKKSSRPGSTRSKESDPVPAKKRGFRDPVAKKTSSAKTPTVSANQKGTRNTDKNGSSKDSDSDSGSSSDSADSEPRMTLSERFAKLTQMSTDKREFAKPVIAMNEIDTKLKVVKDLRNADVKIIVDGQSRPGTGVKPRAKSPEYHYSEGEKRFTADERRRYFERMEKDEPRERPAEWSDSRVRYEYYRDRGCFNERPLSFEEYVKWEQWYYEYRDWLETEGYYQRMGNPDPRAHYAAMEAGRVGRSGRDWPQSSPIGTRLRSGPPAPMPGRRVEQVPARAPLSSRPHFVGRTEGRPGGRSIDRAPSGSLIVNIRQGAAYGPRGRHVGVVRGRPR